MCTTCSNNDCTCQSNCLPPSNLVIPCFSTTSTSSSSTTTSTTTKTPVITYCYSVYVSDNNGGYCNFGWTDSEGGFNSTQLSAGGSLSICAQKNSITSHCYMGETSTIDKGDLICVNDEACPPPTTTTTTSGYPCDCTEVIYVGEHLSEYTYTNCYGVTSTVPLSVAGTTYKCGSNFTSEDSDISFNPGSPCILGEKGYECPF